MPIINVQLDFNDLNVSVQVGDDVYYTTGGGPIGGFNEADVSNTVLLGPIISINGTSIIVEFDDLIVSAPSLGDYISFAKNKKINTTSLLGYYAHVELINESDCEVELFSVGSEITESSK